MNAVKQLRQSTAEGVTPNTVTYSTVIEACARTGHLDIAVELFREMTAQGEHWVHKCCIMQVLPTAGSK